MGKIVNALHRMGFEEVYDTSFSADLTIMEESAEFLNRIDDIIIFSPLTKSQVIDIIKLMLTELEGRLKDREIHLDVTDAALSLIADEAYDPNYGARPVRRFLQKHVETELASEIIKGNVCDGDSITLDVVDGKLSFR